MRLSIKWTAAVCLLLPLIYTARRAPTAHLNGNCVRLLSEDKTEKMGETGETIRMQLSAMLIQTLETFHSSPLCERKNCRTVRDCEGICIWRTDAIQFADNTHYFLFFFVLRKCVTFSLFISSFGLFWVGSSHPHANVTRFLSAFWGGRCFLGTWHFASHIIQFSVRRLPWHKSHVFSFNVI
jgi:hypothetical protein